MVRDKILVVGSGDHRSLDAAKFTKVYAANSSFTRLLNEENLSLVLSEAMLFNEDILNKHPPLPNMSREASNAFRLKKYDVINGLDLERMVIIDCSTVNVVEALNQKNISVKSVDILNTKTLWSLFTFVFNLTDRVAILSNISSFKYKIKFIFQYILSKKMHAHFRPSSGVVAIMLAYFENPDAEIYINGINIFDDAGEIPGFYNGVAFKYEHSNHALDSLYCHIFSSKGVSIYDGELHESEKG